MRLGQYLGCGLLTVIVIGILALGAFAKENGALTIQGTVLPINDLTVTIQSGLDSLDLNQGSSDQTVAVISEKNNDPDGYTVTVLSANARAASSDKPRLTAADPENASFVDYTIKYGAPNAEAEVLLNSSGSAVVTSTSAATTEAGSTKHLKITVPAATWLKADTYSDTIALTISAR